jgi:hypothetical protein
MNISNEFDNLTSLYKQKWCKYVYPQTWNDIIKYISYTEISIYDKDDEMSWKEYSSQACKWLLYVKQLRSKPFRTYAINKLIKQDINGLHILIDDEVIKELGSTAKKLSFCEPGLFSLKCILQNEPIDVIVENDWNNILSVCGRFPQSQPEFVDAGLTWNNYTCPIYAEENRDIPQSAFKLYNDPTWTISMTKYLYNTKHLLHHNSRLCPFRHSNEENTEFMKFPNYSEFCLKLKNKNIPVKINEKEYTASDKNIAHLSNILQINSDKLKECFHDTQHKQSAFIRFKVLVCSRSENNKHQMMTDYCRAYTDTMNCAPIIRQAVGPGIFSQLKVPRLDMCCDEIKMLQLICASEPWMFKLDY